MPGEVEGLNDEPGDASLAAAAASGDRDAFGLLVIRHQASVFRLARVLVRNQADAEDVLQQTFLSAWRSMATFRGDASVRTWLLAITRNAALSRHARHDRVPLDPTPIEDLGLRAGWGGPDPEALATLAERRDWLASAFAQLPDDEREVLTLRELEELSGDETAALLGISLAAMKSRLHRARLALAARLREEAPHATP